MTPAQFDALARMILAADRLKSDARLAMRNKRSFVYINGVAAQARVITEAAADLTTETVRAQLSASLATGEK